MKLPDNVKEKLVLPSLFIIVILLIVLLGLTFTIGRVIVFSILSLLDKIGYLTCFIIFIIVLKLLDSSIDKKQINNNNDNTKTYNANCWTEEELNLIYRDRFLREQRERYNKEKNDTKE
ncbi:MAG: hypothetical protein J6Z11_05945 [Candidatus Riflebacteria bacterium]|nr:hypothetical protein [Candidatus Riflebacteria bacterium]